jgi:two-component system, NtrC family, response regulator AtoC
MKATIFVTDDDETIRGVLFKRLSRKKHHIRRFESGESLLEALEYETPDIILLDLKMTGMSGLETLKKVKPKAPETLVILLTAYGTIEAAVEAMRFGAYDFLIKSIDLDGVDSVIDRAVEYLDLRRRVDFESRDIAERYSFRSLVAESPRMKMLIAQVEEMIHNTRSTVLLEGETGTGKEFFARVLHHNGPRKDAPFVGVNCSAIPHTLFESEFFGFERGAFTGADHRQFGLCEQAEGGTLFLDEIGDLDFGMQAKLLRLLQERTLKRLGGRDDIDVDFRLIAATNRDLRNEVAQGRFREDLFFRLNVVEFELPPLRQRVEDILPLCFRSLSQHARMFKKEISDIAPEARELLMNYQYPGNIRELENIMERAVIFCKTPQVMVGDLPRELEEESMVPTTVMSHGGEQVVRVEMTLGEHSLFNITQSVIETILQHCGGNKSQAAKMLGLTRFALDRRLKKIEALN